MSKKENPIQKHLEEQFKQLLPDETAPEDLKKEVFQTLDTLSLMGDIADLFTAKFGQTEAVFMGVMDTEDTTGTSKITEDDQPPEEEY